MIVGVDGSQGSRAALDWAVDEARLRDLRVEAVMAWHEPYTSSAWMPPIPIDSEPIESWHREELDRLVRGLDTRGLDTPVEPILVRDGARSTLLEAAKGAELLVVGHRGRSELRDALLGSVARYVLSRAPCPVVVVRGARPDQDERRPVVVGFDGSDRSEVALGWAADEAGRRDCPLHVVFAWQPPYLTMDIPLPPTYRTEAASAARARLDQAVSRLPENVDTVGRLVEDSAAQALVDAAGDAALVVVGSRGHGAMTGFLLGSVSQHVVSHAPCPVVIVNGPPSVDPDGS